MAQHKIVEELEAEGADLAKSGRLLVARDRYVLVFTLIMISIVLSAFLGEQIVGVALVGTGVFVVRGIRGGAHWQHVALALAVALAIASYVVVDSQGVKYADPVTYGVLILGIPGVVATAFVLGRGGTRRLATAFNWRSALGGIFSMLAYTLVLIALTMAPAASVSAVRESSVVIAAILGAVVLHERSGPERVVGSVIVLIGVALVVLG